MTYSEIKDLATKLRNNSTTEEKHLWNYLKNRKLCGKKFLRQHPIIYQTTGNFLAFYIPDFYCASEKLTIELDGKVHLYRKEKDAFRDNILNSLGIKVLRIKNEDLVSIEVVLNKIRNEFVSFETNEQNNTPPTPL